jgi:outer membrane protein
MTPRLTTTLSALATAALTVAALTTATAAQAQDAGSFIVRARAVQLDPANKDGTTLGLSINDKTIPEVDFTYFFSPNLAAELVLTVPQKQTVHSDALQADIGSFKHLPPTLTAQYHWPLGSFRPYVGAGVNYTNLSAVHLADGAAGLKHSSWGLAAQAGVDVVLGGGWLLNLDVKKVQIATNVYLGGVDQGKFKVDPTLVGIGIGKRF